MEKTEFTYKDLEKLGIKQIINLGKNALDLTEKEIILNDGRRFDYYAEDNLYMLKGSNL